jgi:hypothetical protein
MVIIHKKIATFGYKQVVYLETCLNLSIYYGYSQYFIVKKTIYIFNLAQKTFLSNKSFFDVVAPLNWQKLVIKKTLIQ